MTMTLFRTDDPAPLPAASPGGDGRISSPPKAVVRVAAVAIVALGVFGLARGVMIDRSPMSDASPLAVLAGVNPQAVAGAKPAVVLTKDDNWSTLSGPRMLDPSEKPKAQARVAASDDDAADSDSPAAQTADAIAPDAPDAAPAAPAASSTAAPTPAPQ
jgi:hypothetical protein